ADGKTSYHSINGEPCFDEQGRFIGYRGTGRDITHHVRAEQELRRSQTLFSAIFAGSPVPLIISRLSDGRHFEANQAALEQFGYAREEIIGKSTAEMGAWPNEETRQTILARLREHRRVDAFEMKLRHRRGHWVDIFYSAQLIEFAGEPCIITTLYDVTERNRAVVLQQELEERFSKVFYASPDAIVISHLSDGTYIDANDAWSELCGYSREEIIGKTAIELDIWASTEDRIELVQRLEKGEKVRSFDFKLRRKDGQIAETVLSSDIIDLNGQRCLLCILSDITERVRADRQLRESERRFADVVDAAGEYVWEADIQWRYTYVSARAEKILGYPSDSIIGKTIYDFMPAPEAMKLAELLETHGRNAEPIRNCEYLSITHSGETIWQQVSAVPYYTDAGKIAGFRGTGLDITARKHAEQRIEELATLDTLTHLPNRRLLNDRLSQGILAAKRNRTLLGVLFIDLDRFKTINDSLGHPIGDVLLQQVARRISGLMRAGDTLSRIGGDEFVVIINGMRHAEDGGTIAKKIITALSQPFHIGGHQLNSSASIGISVYPDDATDGPGLLRNADMAMYFAKQHGRHNYQFFSAQMNVRAIEKLTLENSLRQALERNEFELFYHPKFSLNDLRITGVEALVRWHHPELGLIAPDRFIPIAEESGMIDALGAWVFHQACKQCKKWLEQGFSPGTVAVNLSVGQFNKHLISIIDSSLKQAELDPRWMELEITESLFMQNVEDNISILSQLSNMGIGLAIDDFGTGYSSLAYLRRFRLDTIKIDKSFVRDVVDNMDAAAIIAAIVALAHSLKMNVVAEGVETTEQERLLVMLGCDETQGFLHSEPLAVEQFEALFLNRRTIKTAQEMQA
ncbi:MAG: EAL domain-containing protein, partial [Betaproteobacteria bacterium]|nr:EAL domain-containing protein [Betaproteobacteria bacterium]